MCQIGCGAEHPFITGLLQIETGTIIFLSNRRHNRRHIALAASLSAILGASSGSSAANKTASTVRMSSASTGRNSTCSSFHSSLHSRLGRFRARARTKRLSKFLPCCNSTRPSRAYSRNALKELAIVVRRFAGREYHPQSAHPWFPSHPACRAAAQCAYAHAQCSAHPFSAATIFHNNCAGVAWNKRPAPHTGRHHICFAFDAYAFRHAMHEKITAQQIAPHKLRRGLAHRLQHFRRNIRRAAISCASTVSSSCGGGRMRRDFK